MITTNVICVYLGTSKAKIFNLQPACKENIPKNYTLEYYQKQVFLKRMMEKKKRKQETGWATLMRTAREEHESEKQVEDGKKEEEEPKAFSPISVIKTIYPITASAFQDFEDSQLLAIGIKSGGLMIYDLNLGIEKWFIEECHGTPVSSIAFFEDTKLVSGSNYGTILIHSLDQERAELKFKSSNVMD